MTPTAAWWRTTPTPGLRRLTVTPANTPTPLPGWFICEPGITARRRAGS